jgi:hypothetical protein
VIEASSPRWMPEKTRPSGPVPNSSRCARSIRVSGGATGTLCRAITRTLVLSWCFPCSSGCSPVLADQALDDVGVLDAGGHIGRLAGFGQRRSLFPRLVRPVLVVVSRVLGQDPAEVRFAVD